MVINACLHIPQYLLLIQFDWEFNVHLIFRQKFRAFYAMAFYFLGQVVMNRDEIYDNTGLQKTFFFSEMKEIVFIFGYSYNTNFQIFIQFCSWMELENVSTVATEPWICRHISTKSTNSFTQSNNIYLLKSKRFHLYI